MMMYQRLIGRSENSGIVPLPIIGTLSPSPTRPAYQNKLNIDINQHTTSPAHLTSPKRKVSGDHVMQKAAIFEKLANSPENYCHNPTKIQPRLQFLTGAVASNVDDNHKSSTFFAERKPVPYTSRLIEDVIDSGVETTREGSISPSRDSRESSSPRSRSSSETGDLPFGRKFKTFGASGALSVAIDNGGVNGKNNKWKYQGNDGQKNYQDFKVSIRISDGELKERGFGFTLKGGREKREPLSIETVIKNSPADKAGIQIGDFLLEIDGDKMADHFLTKVNPVIREAMKIGVIELRLRRSIHIFSNGPVSPKESQELSPSSQPSFIEKRSLFEKPEITNNGHIAQSNCVLDNQKSKNGKSYSRRSFFASGDNLDYLEKRVRHRSVESAKNSQTINDDVIITVNPQIKPLYNSAYFSTNNVNDGPVPFSKRSASVEYRKISPPINTVTPQIIIPPTVEIHQNSIVSPIAGNSDYKVTSLHEERYVGKILDFVPESERNSRAMHGEIPAPKKEEKKILYKNSEQEDIQWRRERERIMAKAGPAIEKILKTPPEAIAKTTQPRIATSTEYFHEKSVNGKLTENKFNGTSGSSSSMSNTVAHNYGENSTNWQSANISRPNNIELNTSATRIQFNKGVEKTEKATVMSNQYSYSDCKSQSGKKSPEEAAKVLDKWLVPKLTAEKFSTSNDWYSNCTAAEAYVRRPDHEMGVTSVKRYGSPKRDTWKDVSPVVEKMNSENRKSSISSIPYSVDSVPKSFTQTHRVNSVKRMRTRLQEARDNYLGIKKSSSQQINSNNAKCLDNECYCRRCIKEQEKQLDYQQHLLNLRKEKLKQFTYQITVQDPRKSIARPVAVRQERCILIVPIGLDEHEDNLHNFRKENDNGTLYRVERSQSSATVPEKHNLHNSNNVKTTVPTSYALRKSTSDYSMTKHEILCPVTTATLDFPANENLYAEKLNGTNTNGDLSAIQKRKLSLQQQIEFVENLANKAMGCNGNGLQEIVVNKHRGPPSPKFPDLINDTVIHDNKIDRQDRNIVAVSDRQLCSHCIKPLGRGAAMSIESLGMFFHVPCFKCYICDKALGDGTHGADVRVKAKKLHCQKCYVGNESDLRCSAV